MLKTDDLAAQCLAEQCVKGSGGARDLRKRIRSQIETPVAHHLLAASGPVRLRTVVENGRILISESE